MTTTTTALMPLVGADGVATTLICLLTPALGFLVALWYYRDIASIPIRDPEHHEEEPSNSPLMHGQINDADKDNPTQIMKKLNSVFCVVYEGAHSFLYQEYVYMGWFVLLMDIVLIVVLGAVNSFNDPTSGVCGGKNCWVNAILTATAFTIGCITSILAGFLGMKVGVFSNARTAWKCYDGGLAPGFRTAFKAGAVMGFCLCSLGLIMLFAVINIYKPYFGEYSDAMFEAVAGYGLGGSSIAMFGRVGGGIFTKAADVGADLVGKTELDLPEDDPRNPACIADNVGDNVGDIAGMGSDLFGSFAESTCAALVVASQSPDLVNAGTNAVLFPLLITGTGIVASFLSVLIATELMETRRIDEIEPSLKRQLLFSTIFEIPLVFLISWYYLPKSFDIGDPNIPSLYKANVQNYEIFFCVSGGLIAGLVIGYITEYYTSHQYQPTRDVADSCTTGAATNIIYGLALGYQSVVIPILMLAGAVYVGHSLAAMYGVASAALGILSTLAVGLTIDTFGPVCDNAGGMAEMCHMPHDIREMTDSLDAAGNTTAAIGKGFAIGSAALVSLALFGGFVTIVQLASVDMLQPMPFVGCLIGAMLPYWFSALVMKSVGVAAKAMVEEVRDQFKRNNIMEGDVDPDYDRCIKIATEASLHEMIAPGALVIITPIAMGMLFGVYFLAGMLIGILVSGVQMAISAANTGGAWDNAKKFIEKGELRAHKERGEANFKGSLEHKAAVVGDTVGDPLKDTSGPALNILVKLSAILSLVFATALPDKDNFPYGYLGYLMAPNTHSTSVPTSS